jgi:hypothetical protein
MQGAEETRGGMNGKKKDVPTSASRAQSSMSDKLQMFDDDEGAGKGDDEGSDDDFFTVRISANVILKHKIMQCSNAQAFTCVHCSIS